MSGIEFRITVEADKEYFPSCQVINQLKTMYICNINFGYS